MTDEADPATTEPVLHVDETVLARIAAYETARTPGVARLHPYLVQAVRHAVSATGKRAASLLTRSPTPGGVGRTVDPSAVEVEVDDTTGIVTLTVQAALTTQRPILQTVGDVQRRVGVRISEITGLIPVVVVKVLDVDLTADA